MRLRPGLSGTLTDARPGCGGTTAITQAIELRFRTVSRHFRAFPVLSGRITTRKMAAKADIGRPMENAMTDVAEAPAQVSKHTHRRTTAHAASLTNTNRWVEHD